MSDIYRFRVSGHLDDRWSDWLEGLTVQRQEDGTTVLAGPVTDQAALHGVIIRIRDLGLSLLSVSQSDGRIDQRRVVESRMGGSNLENRELDVAQPVHRNCSDGGAMMRAIVQEGYGAPERVLKMAEVDRPSVGDDDVLVRVLATSVNTPDWVTVAGVPYILRLRFGLWQPPTPVRGTHVAGVVESVGKNVTDLQLGDEVFGSSWADTLATPGTFAEFTVAPASRLIKKPAGLTFEEAAASVTGLTAMIAMRDVGRVGPGTRVLINGASGGVGTLAVQIARALGAEVTGVCSTRNLELVRSLGADHVIDYTQEDFTRGEQRYDVILDNVLNHPPSATAKVLSPTGMLIPNSVGNTGGWFAGLLRMARAGVMGWGSTDVQFVKCLVNRENLDALAALLESGDVKVVIDKVYSLSEAANAVAHMLGHHARGKIVIAV